MRHIVIIILLFAVWSHVGAQLPADRDADANSSDLILNPGPGGMLGEEPLDEVAALKFSQAAIGRALDGYTLYDRQGRAVKLTDYQGKPLIISLVYTSCYHICPTTTQNLARAIKAARSAVGADAFNIATIGFDVRNDTPERMRGFAREQGASGYKNWGFLSTNRASIGPLTANLGFLFVPSSKGFDHLLQTTVVDADGKIFRQIYGMDFEPGFLTGAMQELVLGRPGELLSLSALVNKVRLYCTKYDPSTGTYRFNYSMLFAMGIGAIIFIAMSVVVARVWRDNLRPGTS
ncbi:MAG: SCO family protein [Gammaproteobacteria bacterium]|nr:SCO family protein [Gammaproteobacteria bacterium]